MRVLLPAVLVPLLVAAQPSAGDCRDDTLRDRCAPAEQATMRATFGARAIEAHAAAGDAMRRVFYVDGYGSDLIAVSAVRPRRGRPVLRIDYPRGDRHVAGPLTAPMTPALWHAVDARAAALPWAPPSPRQEADGEPAICLHAWVYTLEAAGPGVRRMTEDACEAGPGQAFATWFADAAVALHPACAALDGKKHRNSASLLRACGILSGRDRVAAALAMNGAHAFSGIGGERDAARLAPHFATAVAIDWAGDRPTAAGAARFWAARMGPGDGSVAHLYVERVDGLSSDRVRLTGKLARREEQAVVEQLWLRQPDGVFRITRATVGPWRKR